MPVAASLRSAAMRLEAVGGTIAMQQPPVVFIGSSSEGLPVAERLAHELRDVAKVRPWSNVFDLGDAALETLFHELDTCDFAVLVATPDDKLQKRRSETVVPRDNVVFEAGLFMGRLGRKRAFVFADSRVNLPSDLAGVTVARFQPNQRASFETAVRTIVRALCQKGKLDEIGFLNAYLRLIDPEHIELSDTYADILTHHYDSLKRELKQLRKSEDWHRLLAIKKRLREYFEYAGMNEEGIAFGRAYVTALRSLGQEDEAEWSHVKDVGYMRSSCWAL